MLERRYGYDRNPDRAKIISVQMESNPTATAFHSGALRGAITAPGDKSISHRAIICGALAEGETVIDGLLESADVLATIAAMEHFGARINKADHDHWSVVGVGSGGLRQPTAPLDFGNSGTGVRLIMGVMASAPLRVTFSGDSSLRARPMGRILKPLRLMGAEVSGTHDAGQDDHLPLTVTGASRPQAITYRLPVPSAQVKSALLFAGLNIEGETCVIEPEATRDHTERMFKAFGVDLVQDTTPEGHRRVRLQGRAPLTSCALRIPGDPSSAAFMTVAALIVPGSEITITNVLVNPSRIGLYLSLREMGAKITFTNQREVSGEPVADLHVQASVLKGVSVPAERAPSMIDEYPILAIAAAYAEGATVLSGLAELRVKESNRLSAIAAGLQACGVRVEEGTDSLTVHGRGGEGPASVAIPGGAQILSHHDHRLAMSFLVMGLAAKDPITVDGADMIATSFPGFVDTMTALGANIQSEAEEVRS